MDLYFNYIYKKVSLKNSQLGNSQYGNLKSHSDSQKVSLLSKYERRNIRDYKKLCEVMKYPMWNIQDFLKAPQTLKSQDIQQDIPKALV